MEINYDYYRIFYYVAKYKSFTQAANILMNNQPNITRSMNNLENQLGCRLFIRSNRGVTLTREGEKLYKHVTIAYQHCFTTFPSPTSSFRWQRQNWAAEKAYRMEL